LGRLKNLIVKTVERIADPDSKGYICIEIFDIKYLINKIPDDQSSLGFI